LPVTRFPFPDSRPDPSPFADLVADIGPAMSMGLISSRGPSTEWIVWLFGILVASLIAEVASRRLRGER
jgi:hypothetical protein